MIRFAVAVLAGATAVALAHARIRGTDTPAGIVLAYLGLAAVGVGFLAARRGAIAAVVALYAGTIAWWLLGLRASPPWAASDVWSAEQWGLSIAQYLPLAIGSAALGAFGSWLRTRIVRR